MLPSQSPVRYDMACRPSETAKSEICEYANCSKIAGDHLDLYGNHKRLAILYATPLLAAFSTPCAKDAKANLKKSYTTPRLNFNSN